MEALCSSEISLNAYRTTRRQISEEITFDYYVVLSTGWLNRTIAFLYIGVLESGCVIENETGKVKRNTSRDQLQ
jgi:hypothetical protein